MSERWRTFETKVLESRLLADDEILTQYGCLTSNPDFFGGPHGSDAGALSLLLGEAPVELACLRVTGLRPTENDIVRRTTVGLLRSCGFVVEFTPEEFYPEHVSVSLPGRPRRWDAEHKDQFKNAFVTNSEGQDS